MMAFVRAIPPSTHASIGTSRHCSLDLKAAPIVHFVESVPQLRRLIAYHTVNGHKYRPLFSRTIMTINNQQTSKQTKKLDERNNTTQQNTYFFLCLSVWNA